MTESYIGGICCERGVASQVVLMSWSPALGGLSFKHGQTALQNIANLQTRPLCVKHPECRALSVLPAAQVWWLLHQKVALDGRHQSHVLSSTRYYSFFPALHRDGPIAGLRMWVHRAQRDTTRSSAYVHVLRLQMSKGKSWRPQCVVVQPSSSSSIAQGVGKFYPPLAQKLGTRITQQLKRSFASTTRSGWVQLFHRKRVTCA